MAEPDERLGRIRDLVNRAEGFISDAEFRDDYETRTIRYQQAMADTLLAIQLQNEIVIELLTQQAELDRLAGG